MKFGTFLYKDEKFVGIMDKECVYRLSDYGFSYKNMNDLLTNLNPTLFTSLNENLQNNKATINLYECKILAPIEQPLQDIICLGLNYMDHAEESARFKNENFDGKIEHAVYFSKRVSKASGANDNIPSHSEITCKLDYEVELAVILKNDIYKASQKEALDSIFGYTIINELSARDLQIKHRQWYFGKSLEGCCVMGPYIVSADEFDYKIPSLEISSYVNGERRQHNNTKNMIFDIIDILMELSSGMQLKAGSIISSGTPSGVGMGFEPPRFLKSGDIVECEIEKIGRLRNMII